MVFQDPQRETIKYVTISELVVTEVCEMAQRHLSRYAGDDPRAEAYLSELTAKLRARLGRQREMAMLAMAIVAGIQDRLFVIHRPEGEECTPLDLDAGAPEYYRATSELGFRLRQLLWQHAHGQGTPA